jgi:diguanylate cyclase (GGDEF)-like protein/PAS domain S-box-containing protein
MPFSSPSSDSAKPRHPSDSGVIISRIVGTGEMAELVRGYVWENSPLGPIDSWSDTLVITVNLILASKQPMFLWWGPDLIQFYNDGYQPIIRADKHPSALGQRAVECWPEIWSIIGPQIESVMTRGESTWNTNQLVPINRNGKLEEVFWTYSYNPIRDPHKVVQGTLVVCSETTEHVLSERRLRALLRITADSAEHKQLSESARFLSFAKTIIGKLDADPVNLPFAVLYLLNQTQILHSASTSSTSIVADPSYWPLEKLVNSQTPLMVDDLEQRFGNLVCPPWPEPVKSAYLLPLSLPGSPVQGVLVFGISPRLPFDDSYQTFVHLVGARISSLLQSEVHQLELAEQTTDLRQQAAVLTEQAALLDLAQDAIVVRDMQRRILFWNRGAEIMYGWTSKDILGKHSHDLLKSEYSEPPETIMAKLLHEGHWEGEASHLKSDGTRAIVTSRWALQCGADGRPARILTINHDITYRKQAESRLLLLTERLSLATAVAKVGVWEWDLASNALTWDATMFEIYGLPHVVPMPYETWSAAVHPEDLPSVEAALQKAIREKTHASAEFRINRTDGCVRYVSAVERVVLDEQSNVSRVIGVNMDNTERIAANRALQDSQAQMTHLAEHDFLTGLPNRMLLKDRIDRAILLAPRQKKTVALLFLDLDGFKHINDSLGHPVGDKLLQSIAKRLVACVRNSDTVSRQGGDEFVVLLSEMAQPEDAALTARRMLQKVAKAHSVDQHELHVTASIGVSVYPEDGLDAETLIKNADTAMYQAKENGRQRYQFFKPEMNVRAVERQAIEEGLRRALERKEFALQYQPKVNLKTGEITGAEALLRWTHPIRGLIPRAQFIPVAEDCGLIVPIGRWVLREASRQARSWVNAGLSPMTMAVNISAIEFGNEGFLDGVFNILDETRLDPASLELELTESALMKDVESTEAILKTLRAKGVRLAVDDFGTGYSSLSYLRKFSVDALKIDQSFVRQITTVPDGATIVTAIISMGRSLNLRVVAEGVESRKELEFLQAHECDEAQGYFFSRPVLPQDFAGLLQRGMAESVAERRKALATDASK